MDPITGTAAAAMAAGQLMSLFGKPKAPETTSIAKFEPEQMDAQNFSLRQALEGLQGNALENKARGDFASKTVPTISERFAGIDGMGSSGYMNSMAQAGRELEGDISAQRQDQLMNLLNIGLTPQYDKFHRGEQPGKMQQFGQGLSNAGSSMMGMGATTTSTSGSNPMQQLIDAIGQNQGGQSAQASPYGQTQPLDTRSDFNNLSANNPKMRAFMNILSGQ